MSILFESFKKNGRAMRETLGVPKPEDVVAGARDTDAGAVARTPDRDTDTTEGLQSCDLKTGSVKRVLSEKKWEPSDFARGQR